MNRIPSRLVKPLIGSVLALVSPVTSLKGEQQSHVCRYCSEHLAPSSVESPSYKKYARDRVVDIEHLTLDITPNFQQRTIKGAVTFKFKAISTPLEELRLDAVDLQIGACTSSESGLKHQVTEREIVLNFSPAIPVGKEATVTIEYSAEPNKGLYFRTKEMGYPESQLWTQGESVESRYWYPCFDDPSEKLTSEVICHLPAGMVAVSNGRLVSTTPDKDGLMATRWVQEKPHTNYLIALVAGEMGKVEDKHRDIPLEFWAIPSDLPYAANSFRHTRHVMEFFEREIGVNYPWAKYGQVTIRDFHWGGMENTSITTLNANTLFTNDTENLFNSDGLVAHELAHQWFGDLLTCKDWSHTWLNEGFATYYDWLWEGNFLGNNELLSHLYGSSKEITGKSNETRGIVWRKYKEPSEMFNYLAYPKGAWVLHMLRSQLGAELYQKAIRTYVERFSYGSVTTDNLRSVFEEISGLSLERFFDQWVYGVGAPNLDVSYSWDEKTGLAKVAVKQTQKISEEAPLFQFPLTIRFGVKNDRIDRVVQIREKEEDFYFPLKAAPDNVRIDPNLSVLAKVNFNPARPMTFVQLEDNTDMVGQLLALEQLSDKPDKEAVGKIQGALLNAEYYQVRIRAAEVLRQARSAEALSALQGALTQSDARVRNAVVTALGGFYDKAALGTLLKVAREEKNPGIVATALKALGPYPDAEVKDVLIGALSRGGYRERIADGAIQGMRKQGDPGYVKPLMEFVKARGADLPSAVLASGLETLGSLERFELKKDDVRGLLSEYVTHPKEGVRVAGINALGNLEDAKAIALLETFSGASREKAEKGAAEKALEKIRGARKEDEELKGLRSEVAELRKNGQELKKEVETLRKKNEPKQ
ncbi:MAG: M1 family aminopeptidase [Verrucomicrobiota bacterium]